MGKPKPLQQCPYNEACRCREKACDRCGWYPKQGDKEKQTEKAK
jgi:hypothetical protein